MGTRLKAGVRVRLVTVGQKSEGLHVYIDLPDDGVERFVRYTTGAGAYLTCSGGTRPAWIYDSKEKYRVAVSDVPLEEDETADASMLELTLIDKTLGPYQLEFPGFDWPKRPWYNPNGAYNYLYHAGGLKDESSKLALFEANHYFFESGALADYKEFCKALYKSVKVILKSAGFAAESAAGKLVEQLAYKLGEEWVFGDGMDAKAAAKAMANAVVAAYLGKVEKKLLPSFDGVGPKALLTFAKDKIKGATGLSKVVGEKLAKALETSDRVKLMELPRRGSVRGMTVIDTYRGSLTIILYVGPHLRRQARILVAEGGPGTLPRAGTELAPLRLPCRCLKVPLKIEEEEDGDDGEALNRECWKELALAIQHARRNHRPPLSEAQLEALKTEFFAACRAAKEALTGVLQQIVKVDGQVADAVRPVERQLAEREEQLKRRRASQAQIDRERRRLAQAVADGNALLTGYETQRKALHAACARFNKAYRNLARFCLGVHQNLKALKNSNNPHRATVEMWWLRQHAPLYAWNESTDMVPSRVNSALSYDQNPDGYSPFAQQLAAARAALAKHTSSGGR